MKDGNIRVGFEEIIYAYMELSFLGQREVAGSCE
jgi:hypothetical protein